MEIPIRDSRISSRFVCELNLKTPPNFLLRLCFMEINNMLRRPFISVILLIALVLPTLALGQTNDAITKFKDEGMTRSQALNTIRYLTDVIGARLTNSPNQRRANQWTKEQLTKWGLQNAAVDPWGEFGRGWELKRFSASVTTPTEYMSFRAYPKAWSPSTNGASNSSCTAARRR